MVPLVELAVCLNIIYFTAYSNQFLVLSGGQRRGFGNRQGASGTAAGGNRRAKTAVTVEELDAELDAYTLQN